CVVYCAMVVGFGDRSETQESNGQAAAIRLQLGRILASRGFVNSARMRQFLELAVETCLAGDAPLKETVVGVQVFGRDPAYDSSSDPIVRVEARRLREKLQQYYEQEGTADPVIIRLARRGYAAEFEHRAEPVPTPAPSAVPLARSRRHIWAIGAF